MSLAPLPEPLESEDEVRGLGWERSSLPQSEEAILEPVVIYADDMLILQRHPETLVRPLFTAVLKEPVTPSSYAMLASVLNLYAPADVEQVGAGDSIGSWLWLDFEAPEIPKPRLAS